jgi:hypothetical protein
MKPKILVTIILIFLVLLNSGCAAFYKNPPESFQSSDLEGIWRTHYGSQVTDQLIIKSDGTYKQIYEDSKINYFFETPWNKWWVENSQDGRMYLHLEGARYYLEGIERAERDGMDMPCPSDFMNCGWDKQPFLFYNPYTHESLEMVGELILTILDDSSGKIVLHHMWTYGDRGFALIGGNEEIFRRIK